MQPGRGEAVSAPKRSLAPLEARATVAAETRARAARRAVDEGASCAPSSAARRVPAEAAPDAAAVTASSSLAVCRRVAASAASPAGRERLAAESRREDSTAAFTPKPSQPGRITLFTPHLGNDAAAKIVRLLANTLHRDPPAALGAYLPGSNARALEKAKSLVPTATSSSTARTSGRHPTTRRSWRANQIAGALRAGGYGRRELVVRTNSLDTPWGVADLRAAAAAGADAVLLPKVEDVSMVQRAFAALEGAPTAIWVMIETPLGVLRAESLAASPLVGCLVAGTNDLAADLRCDGAWAERAALLPSLAQMVLAARARQGGARRRPHRLSPTTPASPRRATRAAASATARA